MKKSPLTLVKDKFGEKKKLVGEAVPYGRMGTAQDLVGMAIFLASAEADYIVGIPNEISGPSDGVVFVDSCAAPDAIGNLADVAIIWAKLDGVIRGFVVDTKTPGFTAQKIERKFSLRASVTSELILEDVEVPETALLPGVRPVAQQGVPGFEIVAWTALCAPRGSRTRPARSTSWSRRILRAGAETPGACWHARGRCSDECPR